ncbi:cytochrome b5-related protein-like [Procambarus clarkii]|uniref:cytochrome b5-related protein-like n=1 Tax=Procambarus clarkii TaxID=6728 RepID=UPI001E671740|nr:cytochrome b5-related protein-like [Procambarus clarkii]
MIPDQEKEEKGSIKLRAQLSETPGSTPTFRRYPTDRDVLLKSSHTWIRGKRTDDDAGSYWRVHDFLYDLTDFVEKHPGGRDWIAATRGTDITEVFESAHLTSLPRTTLQRYLVREAGGTRNSPYTFTHDGFYHTFKRKARETAGRVGTGPSFHMLVLQDCLVLLSLVLQVTAAATDSFGVALAAGIFLALTGNCAHNFLHQRDNWRMYYFDLTFLSSHEMRITHVLSHHAYPNTIYDFEVAVLEPFWEFLPRPEKNFVQRYGSLVLDPILLPLALYAEVLKRVWFILSGQVKLRPENLLPLLQLIVMAAFAQSFRKALWLWLGVHAACSALIVGLTLAGTHHHPDIFHEGDVMREDRDFGLCQLDAVRDRVEVNSNLLLVAVSYGHHTLHHLLPAVDHSKLVYFYPDLYATCKEFGVKFNLVSCWYMILGKYLQLANTRPSLIPNTVGGSGRGDR